MEYETQNYTYQEWPHWYYGPNGEAEIFNSAEEVPPGWKKTPFTEDDVVEETAKKRGRPPKTNPGDF